ncbi:unnamed protein product [Lathyrus sativus]|nr:unnamed protein product [Lathyrus sativus]
MEEHKELGVEKFEKFTCKIENFSRFNRSVYHEYFVLCGYPWKINLYPKGNKEDNYLSIYLEAVKTASMSDGWSRHVKFKLAVFNQFNTNFSIIKECKTMFEASNVSWGWNCFMPLVEFHDPENVFIVNDGCIVGVEIIVYKSTYEKQLSQASNFTFENQTGYMEVEDSVPNLQTHDLTKDPDAELGFAAIGRVIYFLKSRKVKDMNEQACKELQALWCDLAKFKFDLTWLEPHAQSALGMKFFVEKVLSVEKLKEKIIFLEFETARLKEKLVTDEFNMDIEIDLLKAKGLKEIDLDSKLGCGF